MALGFGVVLVLVLIAYMVFPKKKSSPHEKHGVNAYIPHAFESKVEQPVVTSFREQINLEDQAILADFFVEKRKKKQRDELLTEFKSYLDS